MPDVYIIGRNPVLEAKDFEPSSLPIWWTAEEAYDHLTHCRKQARHGTRYDEVKVYKATVKDHHITGERVLRTILQKAKLKEVTGI